VAAERRAHALLELVEMALPVLVARDEGEALGTSPARYMARRLA
jgi:hypothetical protein